MGLLDSFKGATEKSLQAARSAQEIYQNHQQGKAKDAEQRGVILELKSLEGIVSLYEDRIEISSRLGSKHRVIPYVQIRSVKLDKTSALAKGTAAVFTGGMSLAVTNKKRLVINTEAEVINIDFRLEMAGKIKEVMAVIGAHVRDASRANVRVDISGAGSGSSSASVADELGKLASLQREGILTQAEFEAKKKQLLGL